jgi:hypothetical protein
MVRVVNRSRSERRIITITEVCSDLVRHPLCCVLYRWHWKNAALSACLRGTLFFVTNLTGGYEAAIRAMLIECAVRIPLVGMLAAVTQSFSGADPAWAATFVAMAVLPALALGTEFVVHWTFSTPELGISMEASIALSGLATVFTLFAMRRGVMIVDAQRRPLLHDLKQLPWLVVEFVLVLPRAVVPWATWRGRRARSSFSDHDQ